MIAPELMPNLKRKLICGLLKPFEELFNYFLFSLTKISGRSGRSSAMPRRVLIARLDSIGDFVLFSNSLKAYRMHFPSAYLVLLVRENVYNLAETCPYVNEVWGLSCLQFRLNILERLKWFRRLSSAGFDLAINAVYSYSFPYLECLVGWTGAPRRVAFESESVFWPYGRRSRYHNETVHIEKSARFEIDRNQVMLHYLGYGGGFTHKTEIWLKECDRLEAHDLCRHFTERHYAVMFPGAMIKAKRWPAENFVTAAQEISGKFPLYWVICGNSDDAELSGLISSKMTQNSVPNTDLAGKTSLRGVAALMEGASFYLGNDTSGAHIAAAVGTPAIVILGGGHAGRFFPYPSNSKTIAVTHELPCYNCEWQCSRQETECISKIKVDEVVDQALRLLQQGFA